MDAEKHKKRIVIVGAGTAGIMLANKLAKTGVYATVIEPNDCHYYQPAFLFVPFGHYSLDELKKPVKSLLNRRINRIRASVKSVNPSENYLLLDSNERVDYDALVIASGTHVDTSMTEGLHGSGWRRNIFDFYTPDGAMALRKALAEFTGGNLVIQIMDMPIKCPVAPLEFTFLADDYFKKRGIRDKVKLTYVTSLSGAFTKPVASEKLGHMLCDRNVDLVADFYAERVDPEQNKVVCYDGREVAYDLLVAIPVNVGADFLRGSELVNELGFVEVNHHSLQSSKYSNIFAVGDAADVPTSKAGSVAHFEVDGLTENIQNLMNGQPVKEVFDGHANCFVEAGHGKALLLDFNYETQPLLGKFPFAVIGPMRLLKPSRINHWGKLAFRYIYWRMLLPGRKIPFIPAKMSLRGKKIPVESKVKEVGK